MRIAWVGLGKLGMVSALALARHGGHDVAGYDVSDLPRRWLTGETPWPHPEAGLEELRHASGGGMFQLTTSPGVAVRDAEVVFIAVQTPHAPGYDGSQPTPDEPRDFEYGYLVQALRDIAAATAERPVPLTVAVVSTVLPGTCARLLTPLVRPPLRLAYTPSFVAMGTAVPDFLNPEFVLVGADDDEAWKDVARVWEPIHQPPTARPPQLLRTSVVSAETIKVTYNAYLGVKLVTANTLMEMCHDLGADVDEVTGALGLAHRRLMSPAYLSGGMGDGGGCHPRDGLAMSWLAKRLGLSFDLFGTMMRARDAQTRWLADLAAEWAALTRLPVVILGKAYKPGTNITAGSPALLLADLLGRRDPELLAGHYDPHVDGDDRQPPWHLPAVFIVATKHEVFAKLRFAQGSVVIDPWRYLGDQDGVTVVRVGRR